MELLLNSRTYTLKNINCERRSYFIANIFSLYDKKYKHNAVFHKILKKKTKQAIWFFLKPEDKKEIKTFRKMKVGNRAIVSFIETISNKIKAYCDFVKRENSFNSSDSQVVSTEYIYAFLSKRNGWTKEYIREMDELDLLKSLKEAIKIMKSEKIDRLNQDSLVAAYGKGSKQAKRKIDQINREHKRERIISNMMKSKKIKSNLVIPESEFHKEDSHAR